MPHRVEQIEPSKTALIVVDMQNDVTTENCCHATARDAYCRDYKVVFRADATGAGDYVDVGQGGMPGADVHQAALVVLSNSTADVLSTDDFLARTAVPRLRPTSRCHTWGVACA
ncbi:MAG: isochorismatase family protein [Chloroflexi bacterium]|nr:isochorismatase family protein [Chloroflexota bacterium]